MERWSVANKRCTGATQSRPGVKAIAAAFERREVKLATHPTPCALRVAAGQQRYAAQRFTVDHGNRPAIDDAIERVHQMIGRHAINDKTDVPEGIAANGEIAVEIVRGCCGRQALDRTNRIVKHSAAKALELATV